VLNLNGLSDVEQIILLAFALLVAYVVFEILAGLLRIVWVIAVLAWLWVFVLQPTMLNGSGCGGFWRRGSVCWPVVCGHEVSERKAMDWKNVAASSLRL
jgi:hypothetical protein